MQKKNFIKILLGVSLISGIGITNLTANAKCGAGKCGDVKKEKKSSKCGAGKCGSNKKELAFSEKRKKCDHQIDRIYNCKTKATNSKEMNECKNMIVELGKKITHMRSNGKCGSDKKVKKGKKCGIKCGSAKKSGKCGK